jgi:hypothetical protein
MKAFLIALTFLAIPFLSRADGGSAYVFKVTIKYDQGTVKGYIFLACYCGIDSADAKRYYASDTAFTSFVKSNNHRDSIRVYSGIYAIDSLYLNIFFNDKGEKIDVNKIVSIKLREIKEGYIGSWVNPYRFSVKDLSWLKKPFAYQEYYQTQGCSFTIYHFQKQNAAHSFHTEKKKYPDKDLWKLNDEEFSEWDKLLKDYLKFLEKEKVLVREECGC